MVDAESLGVVTEQAFPLPTPDHNRLGSTLEQHGLPSKPGAVVKHLCDIFLVKGKKGAMV